jgi:hypothetical protein
VCTIKANTHGGISQALKQNRNQVLVEQYGYWLNE